VQVENLHYRFFFSLIKKLDSTALNFYTPPRLECAVIIFSEMVAGIEGKDFVSGGSNE
jgi:hypothetical protein